MPIGLPENHPSSQLAAPLGTRSRARAVRIGILNIMPRLQAYEPYLLAPLAEAPTPIEPVFVRLSSHTYQSSDHGHLDRWYGTYERAIANAQLDGLLLTGAPVEELPFASVRYWKELSDILVHVRSTGGVTLGLCWGGMALGKLLGVDKQVFKQKLFGVFADAIAVPEHDIAADASGHYRCAHSRHSGAVARDVEAAERDGAIRVLSRGEESGYTMFESTDGRYVAHLGHPEYEAERIVFEWERDQALGRTDVRAPEGFDLGAPTTTWKTHRQRVFDGFVARAAVSSTAAVQAR